MLHAKNKVLFHDLYGKDQVFNPSRSYKTALYLRLDLVVRRRTTTKESNWLTQEGVMTRFIQGLAARRAAAHDRNSPDYGIFNRKCVAMDQIPVSLRGDANTTLSKKGAQTVKIKTGHKGKGYRKFVRFNLYLQQAELQCMLTCRILPAHLRNVTTEVPTGWPRPMTNILIFLFIGIIFFFSLLNLKASVLHWILYNPEANIYPKIGLCFQAATGERLQDEFDEYKRQFPDVVVTTQACATYDEKAMCETVPHMFERMGGYLAPGENTLVFCDNWSANKTKEVVDILAEHGLRQHCTPENLTNVRRYASYT